MTQEKGLKDTTPFLNPSKVRLNELRKRRNAKWNKCLRSQHTSTPPNLWIYYLFVSLIAIMFLNYCHADFVCLLFEFNKKRSGEIILDLDRPPFKIHIQSYCLAKYAFSAEYFNLELFLRKQRQPWTLSVQTINAQQRPETTFSIISKEGIIPLCYLACDLITALCPLSVSTGPCDFPTWLHLLNKKESKKGQWEMKDHISILINCLIPWSLMG